MAKDHDLLRVIHERNNDGHAAELKNNLEGAIKFYEENIKENYADAFAYERLMIIYRKLKKYKDELRIANKGIRVFADQYANQLKQSLSDRKNKKKVRELSDIFMNKAGLKDKKGNSTFSPEPINKWMKRKIVIEKKISKM